MSSAYEGRIVSTSVCWIHAFCHCDRLSFFHFQKKVKPASLLGYRWKITTIYMDLYVAVEVKAWVSNYKSQLYMGVVIYSYLIFSWHLLVKGYGYLLICGYFTDINTLRPRQNRRHFADDIFKCIFLNENVLISIKISLNFIPKGPIHNIPALVQIMVWRRPGDKPLSEPVMIISLTHICVTRP